MSFEGWREVELTEVIEFNPKESLRKGMLAKKVSMANLKPFTRKIQGYSHEKYSSGSKFRNGDTLLSRITPCLENGKTAYVDILQENEVAFGSTEFIILRGREGKADKKFVYYLTISPNFRDIAIKSMTGTTGRQRAQVDVLERAKFLFPPIEEQRRIACVLSCIDDKIELNNRINKTLEEMAQAIFKSWFVDFEPFRDGEFVESELGMIPKGWEVISLGDFVEIRTRSIDPQKYPDQTFEHYSIPAFDNAKLPVFEKGSEIKSNKYMIDKNSILVSKLNPSQKRVWYPVCLTDGAICSTEFINYRAKEAKFTDFLYSLVNSYRFSEFMIEHATGSTNSRQRVAPKQTLEFKFPIPCESILLSFSKLVKPIYQQINKNLLESKTLKILRDTLLPKLMSGEIRVPLD